MKTGYLSAVLLLSVLPRQALADFVPLGDLPGGLIGSVAEGVSSDGTTVVGASASTFGPVVDEAFLWTQATGMVDLGTLPGYSNSRATSVSGNGTVVVGWNFVQPPQTFEAFRWTQATGMVSLGSANTLAWGVSADGNVVVGELLGGGAFRWTEATGIVGIGGLRAFGASANGAVVVGVDNSSLAFRWTEATGLVSLGFLPGGSDSFATDVSADGAVVVGSSTGDSPLPVPRNQAFRWTQVTGMIGLGDLPGGDFFSVAQAVSADGAVIVGDSATDGGRTTFEAFVWDEANGMQNLRDLLIAQGDDLTGWELASATDVSADGRTIVGWGFDPDGQTAGWLARLGPADRELVTIDVKPGSVTNSINPRSKGRIPVAILTTDTFDASAVDPTTVLFGAIGSEAAPAHSALEDVDGDGNTDLILHFRTQATGIVCGNTSASLTGNTFSGQTIEGSDSIRTVGCRLP